jgi:phage-related minor tail protein
VLGLPGFANGGNISANQLSIIGEKGPELFKPRSAGTVIPNGALGGNTQVTYNIQAVDAASFKSLVASDPEFIFGVSERGRRNLPLRSRL